MKCDKELLEKLGHTTFLVPLPVFQEQLQEVLSHHMMLGSNVPSKSLLSVRGMKGCVSSGEYYLRQGSFGFLSQNKGVLQKKVFTSICSPIS